MILISLDFWAVSEVAETQESAGLQATGLVSESSSDAEIPWEIKTERRGRVWMCSNKSFICLLEIKDCPPMRRSCILIKFTVTGKLEVLFFLYLRLIKSKLVYWCQSFIIGKKHNLKQVNLKKLLYLLNGKIVILVAVKNNYSCSHPMFKYFYKIN